MSEESRMRAAHGPRTLRERVAYALAAHDTFGHTDYTRLLDQELEALHGVITFLSNPLIRKGAPPFGELSVLLRAEREGRGWDKPSSHVHFSMSPDIVDQTWPEWLPMADAALTALMVIPELAQVLSRAEPPTEYAPLPDPIPPCPPRPSESAQQGPDGDKPPPPKRAKRPKAA